MDKFAKILDVSFFIGFILLILTPMLGTPPLAAFNRDFFMARIYLFTGVFTGIRALFKTRPLYLSRKIEWTPRLRSLNLLPALTFTSLGIYQLVKPPKVLMAAIYILSVTCILLFIKRLKQQ